MFKKIIILFFALSATLMSSAQNYPINIGKLTEETQQLSQSPNKMQLVWWVPTDFWKAVFAQDELMPKNDVDMMLNQFEKYTMVVAMDGDIDEKGNIAYHKEDEIFNYLRIFDKDCKVYTPLRYDEIDLSTQRVIQIIKPVLGQMMGKVGENMHFFLFQKKDNPNDKIVNPKGEDFFTIQLKEEVFEWHLPLPSLVAPKKCPKDKKLLDGTWNYCPHDGSKLVSEETQYYSTK